VWACGWLYSKAIWFMSYFCFVCCAVLCCFGCGVLCSRDEEVSGDDRKQWVRDWHSELHALHSLLTGAVTAPTASAPASAAHHNNQQEDAADQKKADSSNNNKNNKQPDKSDKKKQKSDNSKKQSDPKSSSEQKPKEPDQPKAAENKHKDKGGKSKAKSESVVDAGWNACFGELEALSERLKQSERKAPAKKGAVAQSSEVTRRAVLRGQSAFCPNFSTFYVLCRSKPCLCPPLSIRTFLT
jgi:outer membrane biosynthesis protein TonB